MSSESASSLNPPLSPHALAAGTQIRDYTILSVIGTGGFSIVYKAIDNALEREVAIKEYFPASFALRASDGSVQPHSRDSATFGKGIESFLNEGKLLAAFDHPALVHVYRCWEERGTAYIAMRLYLGTTLRDAVKDGHWHTDAVSLRALLQPMCNALDVLHASKCYHRDVAPDNIMLLDNAGAGQAVRPVLLDFGAARKAIESTQVFTAILKPGYAPIEQYGDGELKQGPWTDIYALAGVVHFMLSGNAPPTAISRMLKDAMPRPRDAFVGRLPEPWLDAIECALAVKPELRPQSIGEFIDLLGWDATTDVTTVVMPSTPTAPPAVVVSSDAETRLVDERTVVAPPPRKPPPAPAPEPIPAPAAPIAAPVAAPIAAPVAAPIAALPDDDSTVVLPLRVVETQAAVAPPLLASPPAPTPASIQHARPTGSSRTMIAVAAAVSVAALAGLAWKLTSAPPAPAPAPTPTPTPAPAPTPAPPIPNAPTRNEKLPFSPSNDLSDPKKTSLSVNPSLDTTLPTPPPAPPPAAAEAAAAKAKPKEPRVRPPVADNEAASGSRKRPERCNVLMERFGLGEPVSDADQRFIRESCK